ncbi:c2H2-type domain-containing protein [Caerostris darwini]|uniref:C2H2-type domain-containing protein n=1 Tax=Caerostris darwini TaxID=1538125 RepID=A0AAV4VF45_9ARAC|nr:c2H2-type domain-containing protein [Caerostris darwini]
MNKQHISDSGVSNKNDSYQSDVDVDLDLIDLKLPICPECKKSFTYASSVKRHVHQCHPDNMLLRKLYEGPKRSLNFRCDKCDRKFSEKRNLLYHMRKIHLTEPITKIMRTCPLCRENFEIDKILNHFTAYHDIEIEKAILKFESYDNFLNWKSEIEKLTLSRYVKHTHLKRKNGDKLEQFICHRSGKFKSGSKGLRLIKKQGSNKIDAYCPAFITVTLCLEGMCSVEYQKTHVGHNNDLTHLSLTADEKQILALKIASGASFDNILKDIRNSTSDSRYKRLHLVSRKDLHNIKKSLMIDTFSLTISDEDNTTLKDSSLQNEPQSSTMEVRYIIDTVNNSPLTDSYILNTSQSSAVEVRYITDTIDNTELTEQSLNNELQSPVVEERHTIDTGDNSPLKESSLNKSQSCLVEERRKLLASNYLDYINSLSSSEDFERMERYLKRLKASNKKWKLSQKNLNP